MTIQHYYRFTIATALFIISAGIVSPASSTQKAVDPHLSEKHCIECHVANKIPELMFDGDTVQLCIRCHPNNPPACTNMHIKTNLPPDTITKHIPPDWPLADSKITCLTCHEACFQRHDNSAKERGRGNNNFLRGNDPEDISSFCFNCHQKERFKKTNPHKLDNLQSPSKRPVCFLCHTDDLDSSFEACFEAAVKTKSPSLCIGCHGNLAKGHIVHEQLAAEKLSKIQSVLDDLEQKNIELPLADGRMHCATCHNPHPEGIIGRKEASIGAGEKYLLRIPVSRDLCAVCHPDEHIDDYMQSFQQG